MVTCRNIRFEYFIKTYHGSSFRPFIKNKILSLFWIMTRTKIFQQKTFHLFKNFQYSPYCKFQNVVVGLKYWKQKKQKRIWWQSSLKRFATSTKSESKHLHLLAYSSIWTLPYAVNLGVMSQILVISSLFREEISACTAV